MIKADSKELFVARRLNGRTPECIFKVYQNANGTMDVVIMRDATELDRKPWPKRYPTTEIMMIEYATLLPRDAVRLREALAP